MQIPAELPAFAKSTLLVVSDNEHALFFHVLDRELTASGRIELHYPDKSDDERASGLSPGGAHFAEQSEKLEDEGEHRFAHLLAKELHTRLQQGQYDEFILTAPQERLHEFVEALHNDVKSKLVKTYGKQVTKERPIEVLKRIHEAA
ncbi:host attachment protein [Candidatus Uhrbacteria bacterium]|nr:host attachment protein [Candidatus Uhrbacteria bacterium]